MCSSARVIYILDSATNGLWHALLGDKVSVQELGSTLRSGVLCFEPMANTGKSHLPTHTAHP